MKKMTVVTLGLLACGAVAFAGSKKSEIVKPISAATFTAVPGLTGISKSFAWGDAKKLHGGITKFAKGLKNPIHTHSKDVTVIVISGTIVHTDAAGKSTDLGPGSYLMVPAGAVHGTSCTDDADCMFYEEQPGEFDLKPVEAAKH